MVRMSTLRALGNNFSAITAKAREAMLDERAAVLEAEDEYRRDGKSYTAGEAREMLRVARTAGRGENLE